MILPDEAEAALLLPLHPARSTNSIGLPDPARSSVFDSHFFRSSLPLQCESSSLPVSFIFLPALQPSKISQMEVKVVFSEDPAFVLSRAGVFLSSQPVLHNLVLSILHARVAEGDPGRYWMAIQREDVVGVVLQSPLTFPATLTPMEPPVATAMADAIANAGIPLPGVNGEAQTAAVFSGEWSERSKLAATPFQGNRLYESLEVREVPDIEGMLRQADPRDRSLIIFWTRAFQHEIGESADDTELRVDRGLAAGQLWLWDRNGESVS